MKLSEKLFKLQSGISLELISTEQAQILLKEHIEEARILEAKEIAVNNFIKIINKNLAQKEPNPK